MLTNQTDRGALLFTRASVESISQRSAAYIAQRGMDPLKAWALAIEDEAQLVEHKLSLMLEGALEWDWHGKQLSILKHELDWHHRPTT